MECIYRPTIGKMFWKRRKAILFERWFYSMLLVLSIFFVILLASTATQYSNSRLKHSQILFYYTANNFPVCRVIFPFKNYLELYKNGALMWSFIVNCFLLFIRNNLIIDLMFIWIFMYGTSLLWFVNVTMGTFVFSSERQIFWNNSFISTTTCFRFFLRISSTC